MLLSLDRLYRNIGSFLFLCACSVFGSRLLCNYVIACIFLVKRFEHDDDADENLWCILSEDDDLV
jgi:hypothetical protein